MLRHIIVEGCDGSGKTTLVTKLTKSFAFPIHERASSSLDGPRPDADVWALEDVNTMAKQPQSIYDRHPCISEPIYAPIVRRVRPIGLFAEPGFADSLRAMASEHALLVLCYPPFSFVRRNVFDEGPGVNGQMVGVQDNLRTLYRAYRDVGMVWPGHIIWWNGWQSTSYDYNKLCEQIHSKMEGEYDAK